MLRFSLSAVLSTVLISLLPEVVFSQPLPMGYPVVPANTDPLICYLQTADGSTINLARLCDRKPQNSNQHSSSSFGANQCYFIDAAGRPCTTSASTPQASGLYPVAPSDRLRQSDR